jgi:hypothetical protein
MYYQPWKELFYSSTKFKKKTLDIIKTILILTCFSFQAILVKNGYQEVIESINSLALILLFGIHGT